MIRKSDLCATAVATDWPHVSDVTGSLSLEPRVTLKAAAAAVGVPYFKMRRAAKLGLFPVYRFANSRALVRLSEVDAAINASRDGGAQ